VCGYRIAERFELPVDSPLSKGRIKCEWIEEDVDVFRKSRDQVPAFRKTGAAFEDNGVVDAAACSDVFTGGGDFGDVRGSNSTKRLGDVVILFDKAARSPCGRKCSAAWMIACSKSGCSQSLMLSAQS
jgi:hypothetical protein